MFSSPSQHNCLTTDSEGKLFIVFKVTLYFSIYNGSKYESVDVYGSEMPLGSPCVYNCKSARFKISKAIGKPFLLPYCIDNAT